MRWIVVVLGVGCGRIEFDPLADASSIVPEAAVACTIAACPPGYTIRDAGCYRLVNMPRTWLAAEQSCEQDGGHLVVEDSVEEHFTIHNIATGIERVWVGWTDRRGPDNVFTWVVPDQGGLPQTNDCVFGNGEPSAGDLEHCAAQNGTNSCPDYGDFDCELALPYVCECDGRVGDPMRY